MAKAPKEKDERDEVETQRVRDEALKRALGTPPKSDSPPKREREGG